MKLLFQICLIFSLLALQSQSQSFNSGIVHLVPTPSGGLYSLNCNYIKSDIIIALSSFTFQTNTSCQLQGRNQYQSNFSCSGTVRTVAYLFYERTPMVFANLFTYYFFEGNHDYQTQWKTPNTSIEMGAVRAVLSGFILSNTTQNTLIELTPFSDGKTLKIKRSLNVKIVSFSFILIQNYSPYNLTFTDISLSHYDRLLLRGHRTDYLNFWGIQSLRKEAGGSGSSVQTVLDGAVATDSNILTINSFVLSSNLAVVGLFLVSTAARNSLNCNDSYFIPSEELCAKECQEHPLLWNTSHQSYNFCLSQPFQLPSKAYNNSNIWSAYNYRPLGCGNWSLQGVKLMCEVCDLGFQMMGGQCVCQLGYYLMGSSCYVCQEMECEIQVFEKVEEQELMAGNQFNLLLNLPRQEHYLKVATSKMTLNVTLNTKIGSHPVYFDKQALTLSLTLPSTSKLQYYNISIGNTIHNDQQLFYIQRSNYRFLWAVDQKININEPTSSQDLIKSVAPIFSNSDKSIPLVMLVIFFLGDKVNAFSIFQTVSLIYLTTFMHLPAHYASLTTVIQDIFIFQPKSFFRVTGTDGAWINIPAINTLQVSYNSLIHSYTEGQLFISLSFNHLVNLALQVTVIILLIKLAKNCLGKSSNMVSPHGCARINWTRSEVDGRGRVRWVGEVKVRQGAPWRVKLWIYFSVLDHRKWISITSVLMMQLLGIGFFALYELTLPISGGWSIASRILCLIVLMIILLGPLCLVSYEPLYLLKCLFLVYKRRQYFRYQLWLMLYLAYIQNILFSVIVLSCHTATQQLTGIIFVLICKLFVLKGKIKQIQMLKGWSLVGFFGSILIGCEVNSQFYNIWEQIIAIFLLMVVLVQLLKLFRGVIVFILSLFRQKSMQPIVINKKKEQNLQNPVLLHLDNQFRQKHQSDILEHNSSTLPILKRQPSENPLQQPQEPIRSVYRSKAFRRRVLGQINV